jgi:hypothetical protein
MLVDELHGVSPIVDSESGAMNQTTKNVFGPAAMLVSLEQHDHGVNPKNVFVFGPKTAFKAPNHRLA